MGRRVRERSAPDAALRSARLTLPRRLRSGDGGHALSLSNPGVNVAGATVTVSLSGAAEYKGLLLFAEVDGRPVGTWGKDLPEGVQAHPHCKRAVTHDTYHVGGKQRDDIPWVVPDDLADGAEVVFRATVVRDYATWCARAAHGRAASASSDEPGQAPTDDCHLYCLVQVRV